MLHLLGDHGDLGAFHLPALLQVGMGPVVVPSVPINELHGAQAGGPGPAVAVTGYNGRAQQDQRDEAQQAKASRGMGKVRVPHGEHAGARGNVARSVLHRHLDDVVAEAFKGHVGDQLVIGHVPGLALVQDVDHAHDAGAVGCVYLQTELQALLVERGPVHWIQYRQGGCHGVQHQVDGLHAGLEARGVAGPGVDLVGSVGAPVGYLHLEQAAHRHPGRVLRREGVEGELDLDPAVRVDGGDLHGNDVRCPGHLAFGQGQLYDRDDGGVVDLGRGLAHVARGVLDAQVDPVVGFPGLYRPFERLGVVLVPDPVKGIVLRHPHAHGLAGVLVDHDAVHPGVDGVDRAPVQGEVHGGGGGVQADGIVHRQGNDVTFV